MLARAVADAVALFEDQLFIYTLAGSEMWHAAAAKGLRPVPEFFLDRPLRRDGSVVMFKWWEHFEATPEVVAARAGSGSPPPARWPRSRASGLQSAPRPCASTRIPRAPIGSVPLSETPSKQPA
jgi:hypothetical protein